MKTADSITSVRGHNIQWTIDGCDHCLSYEEDGNTFIYYGLICTLSGFKLVYEDQLRSFANSLEDGKRMMLESLDQYLAVEEFCSQFKSNLFEE